MNQEQRLDYLVEKFKEDSVVYKNLSVGDTTRDKKIALRSFMNIRMPGNMSEEVTLVQDEYLQQEAIQKGIVRLEDIITIKDQYGCNHIFSDKISIWQGDITRLKVDAIVNAANSRMLGCFVPCHRCIDNAIHSSAGIELREECNHQMKQKRIQYGDGYEEPTGKAMLTKGYNLPAKYVIHTVGPIVGSQLTDELRQDLRNCYENVLQCSIEHQIKSVAFCCISTGEFRFPNEEAASIAIDAVCRFMEHKEDQFERIIFNVFKDDDRELYERILR